LKTLEPQELRSGFAEVIKHCLIADKDKWDEIKTKTLEEQDLDDLAAHSVKIKSRIAKEDPREKGLRKILNFGHTIGHAIESYNLPTVHKLLHGEAIAIGMIAEAFLAVEKGFISTDEGEEIKSYILRIYGHHPIPATDFEHIIPLTLQDKKNEKKRVQASLLKSVGEANFNIEISAEEIQRGIEYYNK
jgi:3-dehydroquinate synthase